MCEPHALKYPEHTYNKSLADAVWIRQDGCTRWICSRCGSLSPDSRIYFVCEKCGAKMYIGELKE